MTCSDLQSAIIARGGQPISARVSDVNRKYDPAKSNRGAIRKRMLMPGGKAAYVRYKYFTVLKVVPRRPITSQCPPSGKGVSRVSRHEGMWNSFFLLISKENGNLSFCQSCGVLLMTHGEQEPATFYRQTCCSDAPVSDIWQLSLIVMSLFSHEGAPRPP